jgi:hypothetical protein
MSEPDAGRFPLWVAAVSVVILLTARVPNEPAEASKT